MIRDDVFTEIRAYLQVLLRRWPFVVVPTVVVAALAIATFRLPQPTYSTSIQYIVSQQPTVSAETDEESRRLVWITSQYVVNGLTDWANGTDFSARIARELQLKGFDIDTGEVSSALLAGTIRSKLEIYVDHSDEETVRAISNAANVVLNRDNIEAIPQLGEDQAFLMPIDELEIEEIAPGMSALLMLPIRMAIGAAAGLALALLVEYIDPKIRSGHQLKSIELALLAEIPTE